MKKIPISTTARATVSTIFLLISVGLLLLAFSSNVSAGRHHRRKAAVQHPSSPNSAPPSGTLNPAGPSVIWAGTGVGGGATGEDTCVEGANCDTFVLTLSGV